MELEHCGQCIRKVDRQEVMRIPIGSIDRDGKLIWNYSSNDQYNVKSGYFLAIGTGESDSQGVRCGFTKGLRKPWKISTEDVIANSYNVKNIFQVLLMETAPKDDFLNSSTIWQSPNDGILKLNLDAAAASSKNHVGVGMVGRDKKGQILFAADKCFYGHFSPHLAELMAIQEGCRRCYHPDESIRLWNRMPSKLSRLFVSLTICQWMLLL